MGNLTYLFNKMQSIFIGFISISVIVGLLLTETKG